MNQNYFSKLAFFAIFKIIVSADWKLMYDFFLINAHKLLSIRIFPHGGPMTNYHGNILKYDKCVRERIEIHK